MLRASIASIPSLDERTKGTRMQFLVAFLRAFACLLLPISSTLSALLRTFRKNRRPSLTAVGEDCHTVSC